MTCLSHLLPATWSTFCPQKLATTPGKRLRVGFWQTNAAAQQALREIQPTFPDAWVTFAPASELKFASAFRLNPAVALERVGAIEATTDDTASVHLEIERVTPSTIAVVEEKTLNQVEWQEREAVDASFPPISGPSPIAPTAPIAPIAPVAPEVVLSSSGLRKEADDAFRAKDYALAITLYTKLLQDDNLATQQHALEMLGVARELNGQLAHATQIYRDYLERYPDSTGAKRVQQRFSTLVALASNNNRELRSPIASRDDRSGALSTAYRSSIDVIPWR